MVKDPNNIKRNLPDLLRKRPDFINKTFTGGNISYHYYYDISKDYYLSVVDEYRLVGPITYDLVTPDECEFLYRDYYEIAIVSKAVLGSFNSIFDFSIPLLSDRYKDIWHDDVYRVYSRKELVSWMNRIVRDFSNKK